MHWQKILLGVMTGALGMSAPGAQATLCKYIDAYGHVTYSDSAVKGANQVSCFEPPPVPPAPTPRASPPAGAGSTATPLPNVKPETQRKRDDARRKILQNELAVEEKALEEARKALADGEAVRLGSERNYQRYLDRIQGLKDRVAQHERNVTALKRELANLR